MSDVVRRALAELTVLRPLAVAIAVFAAVFDAGSASVAASPKSGAQTHQPSNKPTVHTPTTAVHTEFVVETNHLGQVTRVRSGVSSKDLAFNAMTYGNALQAFIRTQSGTAVAGTYRLAYDYNPQNKAVRRTVSLLHAGGVDASAPGAVTVEAQKLAKETSKARPAPTPSGSPLPDLKAITGHRH